MVYRNSTKMLWNTLIWLWNGANLSIYKYVTHFVPNIRHKANFKCLYLKMNLCPFCVHIGVTTKFDTPKKQVWNCQIKQNKQTEKHYHIFPALYTVRPLFKKFTQHCETYEPTNCCVKKIHNLCKILHNLCKILHKLCNFFTQLLVGSYVSQCCVKF